MKVMCGEVKHCCSYLCEVVDVEDKRVRHWQSHRHVDQRLSRGGKSFPISHLPSFGAVAAVIAETRLL